MTTLPPIIRERFKPTEAEYRHAISLIPPDTRDLTGVLMGDPLPGDQRRKFKEPTRFGDHGSHLSENVGTAPNDG